MAESSGAADSGSNGMLMVMISLGCLLLLCCCVLSLTGAWWLGYLDFGALGFGEKGGDAQDPDPAATSSGTSVSTSPAPGTTSGSTSCTATPCPCPAGMPEELMKYADCVRQ